MGKILSTISTPMRDFNLESRAHKIISRDKPTVAPKHKSDEKEYLRLLKERPNIEEIDKKNENLDKHLRDVYVTSHDEMPKSTTNPNKPLPVNRHIIEDPFLGYHEPKKVPYGRVTLKSALQFISQHQTNAADHTITKIAEIHKLPEETVKNIVDYFRVYEVYIPEKKSKTQFLGPLIPRKHVVTVERKKITSDTDGTTSQN
ncbi:hypothetical protein RN001_007014 [Aquatica leii]|uniref:Protein NDUFAF4 homolog n=1 Tax=Aquatica leii TaxID=1421715 RepID=A0AAN7SSC9_9COLE|nr:hypothetical protein RN001_007014 [Aquatica leii]